MEEKSLINYEEQESKKMLIETVAKGASDPEFRMFAEFCKSTGLNPFKREIWFIKVAGRVQLMTGIQGYHSIANSNSTYDGIETGLIDPNGDFVGQSYPKEDYIGAWARVFRKDRGRPHEAVAMLKDYDKKQSNWLTMKRVMILKVAESVALRKAFPQQLNGLYTEEEMSDEYSLSAAQNGNNKSTKIKEIIIEPIEPEVQSEEIAEFPCFVYNVAELSEEKYQEIFQYLEDKEVDFDPETKIITSASELKKLKNYLVISAEVTA